MAEYEQMLYFYRAEKKSDLNMFDGKEFNTENKEVSQNAIGIGPKSARPKDASRDLIESFA